MHVGTTAGLHRPRRFHLIRGRQGRRCAERTTDPFPGRPKPAGRRYRPFVDWGQRGFSPSAPLQPGQPRSGHLAAARTVTGSHPVPRAPSRQPGRRLIPVYGADRPMRKTLPLKGKVNVVLWTTYGLHTDFITSTAQTAPRWIHWLAQPVRRPRPCYNGDVLRDRVFPVHAGVFRVAASGQVAEIVFPVHAGVFRPKLGPLDVDVFPARAGVFRPKLGPLDVDVFPARAGVFLCRAFTRSLPRA